MGILGKDFYGNDAKWFVGIVEDKDDPTRSGNIRVRIIGVHSLNKTQVPTQTLPWAQTLTSSMGFSPYVVGDWVFGFFQDGDNAQMPIVMGAMNGIMNDTSYVFSEGEFNSGTVIEDEVVEEVDENLEVTVAEDYSSSRVVSNTATTQITTTGNTTVAVTETTTATNTVRAQQNPDGTVTIVLDERPKVVEVDIVPRIKRKPSLPEQIRYRINGEPTNSRLTRNSVTETMIQRMNENVVAACDISVEVNAAVGWMKIKFGVIVSTIRSAIVGFINSLGLEPTGIISLITSVLKQVQSIVQFIADIIEEINDWIELFAELTRLINAIIHYILSLPARFIQLVRNCLALLVKGVAAFLDGVFSLADVPGIGIDFGPELTSAIDGVSDATGNLFNALGGTARGVNDIFNGILTTPSQDSINSAENLLFSTMESIVPISTDTYSETNLYNQTSYGTP